MNILAVSVSAPPKSGAESLQTAKYLKYLSELVNVTLVTTPVPERGWKKRDDSQLDYLRRVPLVIEVFSINSLGRWLRFISRKALKYWLDKPDDEFLFRLQTRRVMAALTTTPDIIYSRSTPFSSALLAHRLKTKLKKPWVMHLSDPWSDSPYGNYHNHYNITAEAKCFGAADLVSFTTNETLHFYTVKYPQFAGKFIVSPNVFETIAANQSETHPSHQKVIFLHSGNLYAKRNLAPLLKALQLLTEADQASIEVQLAGNLDEYNRDLINRSSLPCIKDLGSLTAGESYRLQREADVLISIDKPLENEIDKVFLPSKIQDYIVAGKIILAITGKNSATYNTVEHHFGNCFEHGQEAAIANFFRDAISAHKRNDQTFFTVSEKGEQFDAAYNAAKLVDQFNKLTRVNANG